MRSSEEMMNLIVDTALKDERIRAVIMEGSRANKNATHDQYCAVSIRLVFAPI